MNKKKLFSYFLLFSVLMAHSFVLTEFFLYSTHRLELYPNWSTYKSPIKTNLIGKIEYAKTRTPLHRNRLNIDSWNGFDGIILNRGIQPEKVEFKTVFPKADSLIHFIFSHSPEGFYGLRLSTDHHKPSLFFRATPNGEFTQKVNFQPPALIGKNQFRIQFTDKKIDLFQNENLVHQFSWSKNEPGRLGFVAGQPKGVILDDINIKAENFYLIQDFQNRTSNKKIFLSSLLFSTFFFLLLFVLRRELRGPLFTLLLSLILISSTYIFDYFFWSNKYFHDRFNPSNYAQRVVWNVEYARKKLFHILSRSLSWGPVISDFEKSSDIYRQLDPKESECHVVRPSLPNESSFPRDFHDIVCKNKDLSAKSQFHIGFIGSSQTYGAGALSLNDSWVYHFTQKTYETMNKNCQLKTSNISQSGAKTSQLTQYFSDFFAHENFDYLFINLGNNDSYENFYNDLKGLIQKAKKASPNVILVAEANHQNQANHKERGIMLTLAKEFSLPVFNLHQFVNSEPIQDSGFLWFDVVHLAPYGHKITGDWINKKLTENFSVSCTKNYH